MLVKFAVKNYRGFENRIEWDLSKVRNYEFNKSAIKHGVVKNGIIYGPNGSGKSNFGLAVFDIVNHIGQKWKKADYYFNFVFAGAQRQMVDFEYTFQFGDAKIEYTYSKTYQGVLKKERLSFDGQQVFNRSDSKFELNESMFAMDASVKAGLSTNANNVSIVNFLLTSYPLPKEHFLLQLQDFVNSMLWFRCLEQREFIGLESNAHLIEEYIIQKELVNDFAKFMEEVSEQRLAFAPPRQNDKQLFCYIKGNPIPFSLVASTGTHSLELLYFWLKHLEDAAFVFVDEFDAFYHFKLSQAVCRKLFALDCQVFMTSHNTQLLTNDLLRPDCNFLLEKNEIRTFHDCTEKELREGHNIEKLYRGGTFAI